MRTPSAFFFKKTLQISLSICLLFVLLNSCKTATDTPSTVETKVKTLSDSLYDDVLALHEMAMPKMGKLMGYQKTAQQKIDSLNVILKSKKAEATEELKAKYVELLAQLKAAEKGMNDWMEGFDPDPKMPTQQELIDYFSKQKTSAQKMKDEVFAAIDSATKKL